MKTLILLHGAPGDGSLWAPVVEALCADVRVLTPTLRWFGPDPWSDDGRDFGTDAHTEQLIGILEDAGDAPVALAGWSYASHVVLSALLARPGRIERAFLYEPGLYSYLTTPEEFAAFGEDAQHAFGPIGEALQTGGPDKAVEALFDSSGGPDCFARLDPARRARYLLSARMMPLLMGGGRPPANITAGDLARVRVPTTVAYGQATRPLFKIASKAVARAIPAARTLPVADAGHMLPEIDPVRFAALLDGWLTAAL